MNKKILIIILTATLLVLGLVGAGFYVVWSKMSTLGQQVPAGQQADVQEKKDSGKNDIGPLFSLDTFIVNLADQNSKRYLRVTMDLELTNELATEEIQRRLPQVRDSILMILPSKRFQEITTTEGKIDLRDEIMTKLNSVLPSQSITNLYFTEFVVQ